MDVCHWALWPHNSPSKFCCLALQTEMRVLMSSSVACYVLSSTGVSAFLTVQGMFLTLRYLEHALIKFLRLVVPHVLRRDGDPTVEIFSKSWAGKLPLLLRFGYKYPFKSICPNYLCIQELLRTYVESTNPSHSLVSLQKPVRGHFPHPCKLFPNFSNFLYFPFPVSFFLCLFSWLSLVSLNFSWGWVDLRVW